MPGPIRRILDQCSTGFTIGQKLGYTALGLLLVASPLDPIPDFLFPFGVADDFVILYLLVRIWMSRTLAHRIGEQPNLPNGQVKAEVPR